MKIPYDEVKDTIKEALLRVGFNPEEANTIALVHTDSSAYGVQSHGLNRIPRFISYVKKGWVKIDAKPTLLGQKGGIARYDGNLGSGVLNALYCSNKAIELGKLHGLSCVSIKNTTHWMRGGTYAQNIAKAGLVGFSFTNTESTMPLWGSDTISVGNNPFCIALPNSKDNEGPIVLDMAMSLYANGKVATYMLKNKPLPFPGGYDKEGHLTTNAKAIWESRRLLPMGYHKGSGMALALDIVASMLAGGKCGTDMDAEGKGSCTSCCQVFIAIDPYLFSTKDEVESMVKRRIKAAQSSHPIKDGDSILYPGQRAALSYKKALLEGIEVDEAIWTNVKAIANGNMDTSSLEAI